MYNMNYIRKCSWVLPEIVLEGYYIQKHAIIIINMSLLDKVENCGGHIGFMQISHICQTSRGEDF